MFLGGEGGEEAEVGFGRVVGIWAAGLRLEVPQGAETWEERGDAAETAEHLGACCGRVASHAVFWREGGSVCEDEWGIDFSFCDEFYGWTAGFLFGGDGENGPGGRFGAWNGWDVWLLSFDHVLVADQIGEGKSIETERARCIERPIGESSSCVDGV